MEWSYASDNNLKIAQLDSGSGATELTGESVGTAVSEATVAGTGNDLALKLNYQPKAAGAYPALLVTYEIVCSKGLDPEKTALVKDFLTFFSSTEEQAEPAGQGLRPAADRPADQGQDRGLRDLLIDQRRCRPVVCVTPRVADASTGRHRRPHPQARSEREGLTVTDTTRQPGDGRTGTVEPVVDPLGHARTGVDDGVPVGHVAPEEPDPLTNAPRRRRPDALAGARRGRPAQPGARGRAPRLAHQGVEHGRDDDHDRPGTGVKLATISRTGDLVFGGLTKATAVVLVLLVAFVGIFLLVLALPSILADQDNFLTSRNWQVSGGDLRFGILGLLWTTVLSSLVALVIAVPVAVGVALSLTQYLPKRVAGPVGFLVELLAAVPSIIFGLWGLTVFGPFLGPIGAWIGEHPRLHPALRRRSRTRRAPSSSPASCWRSWSCRSSPPSRRTSSSRRRATRSRPRSPSAPRAGRSSGPRCCRTAAPA